MSCGFLKIKIKRTCARYVYNHINLVILSASALKGILFVFTEEKEGTDHRDQRHTDAQR